VLGGACADAMRGNRASEMPAKSRHIVPIPE